jgi:predicted signal transduction protein with EAL and GGDEF domain
MIAGLAQFVRRVGSELIAEGIEQPGELAMVRELGVHLGQGYLLGRPAPVPTPARKQDRQDRPPGRGRRAGEAVPARPGRSVRGKGSNAPALP